MGFKWGAFTITPRSAATRPGAVGGTFGGWQIRCPFHRKNDRTECKRWFGLEGVSEEDKQIATRRMLFWAVRAVGHDRQWEHMQDDVDEPPEMNVVMALKDAVDDRPPVRPSTDIELDAALAGGKGDEGALGRGRGRRGGGRGRRGRGATGRCKRGIIVQWKQF